MKTFLIGDVCKFLGVKTHVLRYWEREIPLLSPRKDMSGRRIYTWKDLEMLYRIKHLLYERGYTVSGAKKRLWEDMAENRQNIRAVTMSLRSELIKLSFHTEHLRLLLEGAETHEPHET